MANPVKETSSTVTSETLVPLKAWLGVVILWFFYVLSFMDRGIIALMVSPIMKELGLTQLQIGVLQGFAFAVVYCLAALPLGLAIDYVSRRNILFAGVLCWSAGTLACGLAQTFPQILLARATVGLGEAMLVPASLSLIADMFPRHRIATATAFFSSGATVGSGGVFIVGGVLLNHLANHDLPGVLNQWSPWRLVFLLFGAVGVVAAVLAYLVPDGRARLRAADGSSAPVRNTATMQQFWAFVSDHAMLMVFLLLSFPLLGAVMNAFLAWAPHHFELQFGWDMQKVGLVLGPIKLIMPPLGVVCGGLLINWALRAGMIAPHFLIPMVCVLIGGPLQAAGLMQTDPTRALIMVAVGQFIFSAYGSAQYSVLQLLAPPALRGRFAGLYLTAITLIGTGMGAILPPFLNTFAATTTGNIGHATALAIVTISLIAATVLALGRKRLHAAINAADRQSAAQPA